MEYDPIERLLKEADGEAGDCGRELRGVAGEARRIVRRRRMARRVVAGAAAVVLVVGAACWQWVGRGPGRETVVKRTEGGEEVRRLKAEVEELRREADWRMRLARRLMEEEEQWRRAMELRRELARGNPMEALRERVDYAAFAMVYQGDRMSRELGLAESAERLYRECSRDFPGTQWGQVARQRLAEMKERKEG